MHKNLVGWMHAVVVTGAFLAILSTAFVVSPEIEHRVLTAQLTDTLAVDFGQSDSTAAQPESEEKCHVGHGCLVLIVPIHELAFIYTDRSAEFSLSPPILPTSARDIPFHPPRVLS